VSDHPAAGDRGMTLGVRNFAATLLTPRPAIVPSKDSPKMFAGMPAAAGVAAPALGTASAVGSTAGDAVAAQVCGTDNVPASVARPIAADIAGALTWAGATDGRGLCEAATNGPKPWKSSRSALTAMAWLVVAIELPDNDELTPEAAALPASTLLPKMSAGVKSKGSGAALGAAAVGSWESVAALVALWVWPAVVLAAWLIAASPAGLVVRGG
jgi:hypothetical protein